MNSHAPDYNHVYMFIIHDKHNGWKFTTCKFKRAKWSLLLFNQKIIIKRKKISLLVRYLIDTKC